MQAPVDICYAGVVVARAEEVREAEGGDLFVVMKEPLPVGTLVGVSAPDAQFAVRVAHVVETADGADNGMRVHRLAADDPGAAMWIPPPPPKPAPAPPAAEPAPAAAAPPASQDAPPEQAAPAQAVAAEAAPPSPAPGPSEEPAQSSEPPVVVVEREAAVGPVAQPVSTGEPAAQTVAAPSATDAPVPHHEQKPVVVEAVATEPAAPVAPAESAVPEAVSPNGSGKPQQASESGSAATETSAEPSRPTQQVLPLDGDLPPARPVQGASGRRRTKRRK